jgi:dihydroneopterin aldolase
VDSTVTDCIRVEELEIFGRVGVTENERANPQRLTVTISVWPRKGFDGLEDDIARTVNYSAICVAVRDFAREHTRKLIETLVVNLATHLLEQFPIHRVEIELRKFVLPDAKHVAVIVTRTAEN